MSQQRRLLIAVATIAVLIVAGFVIRSQTSSKASASSPERKSLIAAAALPDCPATVGSGSTVGSSSAAGSGSAAGTRLPKLTLPCLGNGPSVDFAKLHGPLVVNIWAGTCTDCRAEAPFMRSFAAAARGKVDVLGVVDGTYPSETWDDALDASRGLGLHYPSLFDGNGQLVQWTRAYGIPVSLLIKPDGTVAYTQLGPVRSGQLQQLVKKYLGIDVAAAGS